MRLLGVLRRAGTSQKGFRVPAHRSATFTHAERATIFALATAAGRAGVGIIRISGPQASPALLALTRKPELPEPRKLVRADLYDAVELVDKAMVVYFPGAANDCHISLMHTGPNTFTGEDVIELHIHSVPTVIASIYRELGKMHGVRLSEPGEFTKRAFYHGKLDLTGVEALADLLQAETETQTRQALWQLGGGLRERYDTWRKELIRCLAFVEAYLDFAEDEHIEVDVLDNGKPSRFMCVWLERRVVGQGLQRIFEEMTSATNDHRHGEIIREGLRVTLCGPPNAGKSSLMNLLAKRRVSIVSKMPGTTRDALQVSLDLAGYSVHLSDTAGLRDSDDEIEREGVRVTKSMLKTSEYCIFLIDASVFADDLNWVSALAELDPAKTVFMLNKLDLLSSSQELKASFATLLGQYRPAFSICPVHLLSCTTNQGIEEIVTYLAALIKNRYETTLSETPAITRARHREHICECMTAIRRYLGAASRDLVLAAEDLRSAISAIGKLTGQVDPEEVLDVVFSSFCIGK